MTRIKFILAMLVAMLAGVSSFAQPAQVAGGGQTIQNGKLYGSLNGQGYAIYNILLPITGPGVTTNADLSLYITGGTNSGGNFVIDGIYIITNSNGKLTVGPLVITNNYAAAFTLQGAMNGTTGSFTGSLGEASISDTGPAQIGGQLTVQGVTDLVGALTAVGANFSGTVAANAEAITQGITAGSAAISTNVTIGGTLVVTGAITGPVPLTDLQAGGATVNQILSFNGTSWVPITTSGGGTVLNVGYTGDGIIFQTAVPGSPITVNGTFIPQLLPQIAGSVLAGPVNGSPATPTFQTAPGISLANATGLPTSALPNPLTVLQSNAVFVGTETFTNKTAANGVQAHLGANSGALAIRGSGANTNTLSVESGVGAQWIQDWSVITATTSNNVATLDTNANLTLKNGGKIFASIPATNIDASMGVWTLTNCYHDCQYATNGSMLSGGTNLFGGPFTAADVGKQFVCDVNSSQFAGTIISYLGPNTVGTSITAGTTVTNRFLGWTHDDSATINSQITNALSNGCHTIAVPPGAYGLLTWTTLPYGAGSAAIALPFTNCDLFVNGEQTLKFMGLQTPQALPQLSVSFPQPLATNGAIFCCPTNPPSAANACLIGCPVAPNTLSYGFDGLKLILQDLTFRMAPNPGCSCIKAKGLSSLELHGTVVVDSGTPVPYAAAASTPQAYGIYFPQLNNWGKNISDFTYVEGFYTGYFVTEHVTANYMFGECNHTCAEFGTSYHANYIARMLCQGTGYVLYDSASLNETYIGELDVEEDETLVTGLNFVNVLFDQGSNLRGGAGMVNLSVGPNQWGTVTNSSGCANFNMPNVLPALTGINVGQYSALTVTTNFTLSNSAANTLAAFNASQQLVSGPASAPGCLANDGSGNYSWITVPGSPGAAVVNVKNPPYNAKGDGVTDDTVAISNACVKNPNGVIYIPGGTNLFCIRPASIYLTNGNQIMVGDGNSILSNTATSGTGTFMVYATNASVFHMNFWSGTYTNINGLEHCSMGIPEVIDCHFFNLSNAVFAVGTNSILAAPGGQLSHALYSEITASNCYYGFHLDQSNAVEYCRVYHFDFHSNVVGIFNETAANVDFVGGITENNSLYNLWIHPSTTVSGGAFASRAHSLYEGLLINHGGQWVQIDNNASNVVINSCVMAGPVNNGNSVVVSGYNDKFQNCWFEGGQFVWSVGTGNVLENCTVASDTGVLSTTWLQEGTALGGVTLRNNLATGLTSGVGTAVGSAWLPEQNATDVTLAINASGLIGFTGSFNSNLTSLLGGPTVYSSTGGGVVILSPNGTVTNATNLSILGSVTNINGATLLFPASGNFSGTNWLATNQYTYWWTNTAYNQAATSVFTNKNGTATAYFVSVSMFESCRTNPALTYSFTNATLVFTNSGTAVGVAYVSATNGVTPVGLTSVPITVSANGSVGGSVIYTGSSTNTMSAVVQITVTEP